MVEGVGVLHQVAGKNERDEANRLVFFVFDIFDKISIGPDSFDDLVGFAVV